MRAGPALLVAGAVVAASLLASSRAAAETSPPSPSAPASGPLAPLVSSPAPAALERRSPAAFSVGLAGVSVGGILLVSSVFVGAVQASCDAGCRHVSTVVGLVAAGGVLVAVGIPLIVWGAKSVPVVGPTAATALVPRKTLPAWAGTAGSEGWVFRF